MAVQSEGAVVERRDKRRNRLMVAAAERAFAEVHDVARFVHQLAEIGARAETLHNQRDACFFVKLGGVTLCGLWVNDFDVCHR